MNRPDLRERINSRLAPCADPDCGCAGCLLWPGSRNPDGYGMVKVGPRPYGVHRVLYELEVGPIPDGLQIDHVHARGCRHKNCANIAHLEPVTPSENVRRAKRPATHCRRGHEFTEANTYRRPRHPETRYCRECRTAYKLASAA